MSAVPVTIHCFVYPRNKTVEPFPATIVGWASITGLGVGGGPVEPPPDIHPEPPLEIWGPPGPWVGYPPDEFPPDAPPEQPPARPEPPHEGWNWSAAKNGWYYLYVPGEGEAQPKGRR